jgi:hypothetical protein
VSPRVDHMGSPKIATQGKSVIPPDGSMKGRRQRVSTKRVPEVSSPNRFPQEVPSGCPPTEVPHGRPLAGSSKGSTSGVYPRGSSKGVPQGCPQKKSLNGSSPMQFQIGPTSLFSQLEIRICGTTRRFPQVQSQNRSPPIGVQTTLSHGDFPGGLSESASEVASSIVATPKLSPLGGPPHTRAVPQGPCHKCVPPRWSPNGIPKRNPPLFPQEVQPLDRNVGSPMRVQNQGSRVVCPRSLFRHGSSVKVGPIRFSPMGVPQGEFQKGSPMVFPRGGFPCVVPYGGCPKIGAPIWVPMAVPQIVIPIGLPQYPKRFVPKGIPQRGHPMVVPDVLKPMGRLSTEVHKRRPPSGFHNGVPTIFVNKGTPT